MSHPSEIAVSFFDIVLLYKESEDLIGYWVFLIFGLCCHIGDVTDENTGVFFKTLSLVTPWVWYFNQSLSPGEVLHLALPTIFAWSYILLHLMRNPLGTVISLYLGAQAFKHATKD